MNKLFKYQEFVKHTLNESIQDVINEEIIDSKEWPIEKTRELFTITIDNFREKLKSEIDRFIEINITQDKELFSSNNPSGIYNTYRESKLAEKKYLKKSFMEISEELKKVWNEKVINEINPKNYSSDIEKFKTWNWAKGELKKIDVKNSFEIASKIGNVVETVDNTKVDALKKANEKTPQDLFDELQKYIINGRIYWYQDAEMIINSGISGNDVYNKSIEKLEIIPNSPYKGLKQAIENKFKEYYTLYRIYMFANALADGMESVKVKTAETTSNIATATSSSNGKVRTTSSEPIRKLSSSERQAILSTRSGL